MNQSVGGPVLAVEDLTVEYRLDRRWVTVIDGVDLTIGAGEAVGLVGESGSGKSVTCLSAMQLLPAQARIVSGSIRLQGAELLGRTRRELEDLRGRDLAMIFQDPMTSLDPVVKVGEQIAAVVRRHRGVDRAGARRRAIEMLDAVGIVQSAQRFHAYPHELSGGMRQRVMIAMALSCEPVLLIADEPTTALDVTVQAQVLDVIRTLCRELGTAVLFVTHDLGVVADLCDRVVVMYAGQVVETAAADVLFEGPSHPYAAELLRALPLFGPATGGDLATIPGVAPRPGSFPSGCRFAPRCPLVEERCRTAPVALRPTAAGACRCVRAVAEPGSDGGAILSVSPPGSS